MDLVIEIEGDIAAVLSPIGPPGSTGRDHGFVTRLLSAVFAIRI